MRNLKHHDHYFSGDFIFITVQYIIKMVKNALRFALCSHRRIRELELLYDLWKRKKRALSLRKS